MENNDFVFNYLFMNPSNPTNKYLSPSKDYQVYQSNSFVNKENFINNLNTSFYNNISLSYYATPKKIFQILEQDNNFSPNISNSKNEIINNNLLTTFRKNSLNDLSPFKPMISPYINSKNIERK